MTIENQVIAKVADNPVYRRKYKKRDGRDPVSYTHLTLPTICSV